MKKPAVPADPARQAQLRGELERDRTVRLKGYREQALKLFPHVCASCGRAFEGDRLRELTVHHRDHDYHHNPPDGSNWELLCLYCHDHEHEKNLLAGHFEGRTARRDELKPSIFSPFDQLDALLKQPDAETKTDEGAAASQDTKPPDSGTS